jgi:hypothetical protein
VGSGASGGLSASCGPGGGRSGLGEPEVGRAARLQARADVVRAGAAWRSAEEGAGGPREPEASRRGEGLTAGGAERCRRTGSRQMRGAGGRTRGAGRPGQERAGAWDPGGTGVDTAREEASAAVVGRQAGVGCGGSAWARRRCWRRAAWSEEVEQQHWASASMRLRLGVSARDTGTGVCGHGAARRAGLNVQVELWCVQVRKLMAPAAVRRGVAARRGRRGSVAGVSSAGSGKMLREMQERDGRIEDAGQVFDEMPIRVVLENARVLLLGEASRVQDAVRRMLRRCADAARQGRGDAGSADEEEEEQ